MNTTISKERVAMEIYARHWPHEHDELFIEERIEIGAVETEHRQRAFFALRFAAGRRKGWAWRTAKPDQEFKELFFVYEMPQSPGVLGVVKIFDSRAPESELMSTHLKKSLS